MSDLKFVWFCNSKSKQILFDNRLPLLALNVRPKNTCRWSQSQVSVSCPVRWWWAHYKGQLPTVRVAEVLRLYSTDIHTPKMLKKALKCIWLTKQFSTSSRHLYKRLKNWRSCMIDWWYWVALAESTQFENWLSMLDCFKMHQNVPQTKHKSHRSSTEQTFLACTLWLKKGSNHN